MRPPEQPNCETVNLEGAAARLAWVSGASPMQPNDLHNFVSDRWRARQRRAKKPVAAPVVKLDKLCGGRGAVAVRSSSPIYLDEAFVFRFPIRPEREPTTSAERERRHARDLRELVAFLVKVHRGTARVSSSAPSACAKCGRTVALTETRCSNCGQWRRVPARVSETNTATLDAVEPIATERIVTGGVWDEVWGGGFAASSVSLIGGRPGGGKTSLLLQIGSQLAEVRSRKLFFVNVEMTGGELRIAGQRLRVPLDRIVACPTFAAADIEVEDFGIPAALILDSVSALVGKDAYAAIEVAKRLKKYATKYAVPVFLVAHVQKEGDFAGLASLQHEVDVLIRLDAGDGGLRVLKAIKNRFGPTRAAHHLIMTETGLAPWPPSTA